MKFYIVQVLIVICIAHMGESQSCKEAQCTMQWSDVVKMYKKADADTLKIVNDFRATIQAKFPPCIDKLNNAISCLIATARSIIISANLTPAQKAIINGFFKQLKSKILQYSINSKSLSIATDKAVSNFYAYNDLSTQINQIESAIWSLNPGVCACIKQYYLGLQNEVNTMVYRKIDCLKSLIFSNSNINNNIFCGIIDGSIDVFSSTLSKCLSNPKTAISCFTNLIQTASQNSQILGALDALAQYASAGSIFNQFTVYPLGKCLSKTPVQTPNSYNGLVQCIGA